MIMKRLFFLFIWILFIKIHKINTLDLLPPESLTIENIVNEDFTFIEVKNPFFSWKLPQHNQRNLNQIAFQVI